MLFVVQILLEVVLGELHVPTWDFETETIIGVVHASDEASFLLFADFDTRSLYHVAHDGLTMSNTAHTEIRRSEHFSQDESETLEQLQLTDLGRAA